MGRWPRSGRTLLFRKVREVTRTQVYREEEFHSSRQGDAPAQPATLWVSVVVPFYNEEACVVATIRELLEVLTAAAIAFDVVAVDDGSTNHTVVP
jgi:hypothetical protein